MACISAILNVMITRHAHGKVTWIDLESPTPEELASVVAEFGIDARVEEEIRLPTPYPLFVAGRDYRYLILHFPTTASDGGARDQEVDFVVGKRFLITVRYDVIDSIHNLHKVFEAEELLGIPVAPGASDVLLERVLRRLYGAIRHEVEHGARRIDRIEHAIFAGHERETVKEVSDVGRILLRFETTLARHQEPLNAFLEGLSLPKFFGTTWHERIARIEAERRHVAALVASYRQVATELRDTNDSILSSSQNEIMKTLTVVNFVMFPLTLIAALFQMGLPGTPLVGISNAFWIVVGMMIAVTGFLTLYIIRKGWL